MSCVDFMRLCDKVLRLSQFLDELISSGELSVLDATEVKKFKFLSTWHTEGLPRRQKTWTQDTDILMNRQQKVERR